MVHAVERMAFVVIHPWNARPQPVYQTAMQRQNAESMRLQLRRAVLLMYAALTTGFAVRPM
jgi:hypothetical protein